MKDLKPLFNLITEQGCVMMFSLIGTGECYWLAQLINDSHREVLLSDITPIEKDDILALQSLEVWGVYSLWGLDVMRVEDEEIGVKLINEEEGIFIGEDDNIYSLTTNCGL